ITVAPVAASAFAHASPMPPYPPATNATLPSAVLDIERALLAEQPARPERHDRDEQQVHRQERPFGGIRPAQPDDDADQQCSGDRTPEAADAAQDDDEERGDDGIHTDVGTHAPDRRHDDARESGERD